jgi:hypothetical protein
MKLRKTNDRANLVIPADITKCKPVPAGTTKGKYQDAHETRVQSHGNSIELGNLGLFVKTSPDCQPCYIQWFL